VEVKCAPEPVLYMSLPFQTLDTIVEVSGIALHCGQNVNVRLLPSELQGFTFVRVDLPDSPTISASWANISATTHATVLKQNDATISTTEHLLAALWSMGFTHCRIEVDGPEIPILDGSAQGWCDALQTAGIRLLDGVRPLLGLKEPVWFDGGGAQVLAVPSDTLRLSVAVDFDHPHINPETFDCEVTPELFNNEIASARTFTLESWLEPLRSKGLIKGGSPENAIVFFEDGPSSPLRFPNELARHKALDALGDLALLFEASQFRGHFFLLKAGHGPHQAWMKQCLQQKALLFF
jgi:UDP-3-O-[3-hydroxymyristoyl] N-acetylglucosamine deacetylase